MDTVENHVIGVWLFSGIVIGISLLQAGLDILGLDTSLLMAIPGWYGIGTGSGGSGLLIGSLGLIALAGWIGQGAGMLYLETRSITQGGTIGAMIGALGAFLIALFAVGGIGIDMVLLSGYTLIVLGSLIGAVALYDKTLLAVDAISTSSQQSGGTGSEHASTNADKQRPTQAQPNQQSLKGTQDRFEQEIGEESFDILGTVAPDATRTAQRRYSQAKRESELIPVDEIKETLQEGVTSAVDSGRLDMTVTSRYGEAYTVVNLPTEFRETTIPPSNQRIHIDNIPAEIRDLANDPTVSVRDLAAAVDTAVNHQDKINKYIEQRETEFESHRQQITSTIEQVERHAKQYEGAVGKRIKELLIEGRSGKVSGVTELQAQINDARQQLHTCSFDAAVREIKETKQQAEQLLTAVDFLGGFIEAGKHGKHTADSPNEQTKAILLELNSVLQSEHGLSVTTSGDQLTISEQAARTHTPVETTDNETTETDSQQTIDMETATPEELQDEILFCLRELERHASRETTVVEYQTDRAPKQIAKPTVFVQLINFARKQTDIVARATVQDNAPPGFLTIEFTDDTSATKGIRALHQRFSETHSS